MLPLGKRHEKMDYNEEYKNHLMDQEARRLKSECLTKFKKELVDKSLEEIKALVNIQWHASPTNIDFDLQGEQLDDKYIANGYHILKVLVEEIVKNMVGDWGGLFALKELWNNQLDEYKTLDVLWHWKDNEALIPPFFTIHNGKISPSEGKHRFNASYALGEDHIHLIISTIDKAVFDELEIEYTIVFSPN